MTELATLLPQQAIFTPTPSAIITPVSQSTPLSAVALPSFAPLSGLPGEQIIVDTGVKYQEMLGFGAALTDSTCYALTTYLNTAQRSAFLQDAFGTQGLSTTRVCMGTSDFNARASGAYYTYDDVANDTALTNFSVAKDAEYIIPCIQQALAINPRLKVIASPWSPPAWMKTNNALIGSGAYFMNSVTNFTTYAQYFVKFIQAYAAYGIPVYAVTVQNEPNFSPSGYPGCAWAAADIATFIGSYLGPAFDAAGITTKIWPGDAAWGDTAALATTAIASATAGPYCDGAAYHGYDGSPLKMAQDMRPYGSKSIHMTECSTFQPGLAPNGTLLLYNIAQDQAFCAGTLAVGCLRYGASSLTLWNLLLDPNGAPVNGAATGSVGIRGCASVTSDGQATVVKNPEYYMLAHLARFVQPGARRVASTTFALLMAGTDVESVAFLNPDGSVATFLYNGAAVSKVVTLTDAVSGLSTVLTMNAGDMATVSYAATVRGTAALASNTFVAPGAPTSLTAQTSGSATILLGWTAPASTGSGQLGGYLIRRGTTAGGENRVVGVAPAGTTSYTDFDVAVGTTYYYTIQAYGAGGFSTASNEATFADVANAPSNVTLGGSAGNTQDVLTMSATANGASVTSFQILRGTSAGGESATAIGTVNTTSPPTSGATSATYTDTTAVNGTAYYYKAVAVSSAGSTTSPEVGPLTPSGSTTGTPAHYLKQPASANNAGASAPSAAANESANGVVDVRVWCLLSAYKSPSASGNAILAGKYAAAVNSNTAKTNSEWAFTIGSDATANFAYYDGGGTFYDAYASTTSKGSGLAVTTAVTPDASRGVWLRAVANLSGVTYTDVEGATHPSGTVQFYYAQDNGSGSPSSWSAMGVAQPGSTAGVGQIGAASSPFQVLPEIGGIGFTGDAFKVIVYDAGATAGTQKVLVNVDFTAQATTATIATAGDTPTFADSAPTPNTFTIYGPSAIN